MNERTNDADARSDGILSPEDLALDEDHVTALDENRLVVSARTARSETPHGGDARLSAADSTIIPDVDEAADADGPQATTGSPAPADVLGESSARYGVDLTVKTDDGIAHETMTSDDIREVFERMLRWYAGQLDDELEPEETLSLLLDASGLELK
ncbi:DUF7500 family protein [Haloarchaeobius sp. TZWWS8]|uniref:DUF7500 family protein n=1 Tax=Haloarchaeobius sp. TZWWS8 TaxID=3446121 RepID=UPI003EB8A55E